VKQQSNQEKTLTSSPTRRARLSVVTKSFSNGDLMLYFFAAGFQTATLIRCSVKSSYI